MAILAAAWDRFLRTQEGLRWRMAFEHRRTTAMIRERNAAASKFVV
jgi:hypothetical protein